MDDSGRGRHSGAYHAVPAFLQKTYEILESPEHRDYVSWDESGERIIIKKVGEFSAIVLPRYFKHNNFQSFVRQLNMYNFHKVRHKSDWREFQHPMFRRGQRHLLHTIKRKTSGGSVASSLAKQQSQLMQSQQQEMTHVQQRMGSIMERMEHTERMISSLAKRCSCLERENHYLWQAVGDTRNAAAAAAAAGPGPVKPDLPSSAAAGGRSRLPNGPYAERGGAGIQLECAPSSGRLRPPPTSALPRAAQFAVPPPPPPPPPPVAASGGAAAGTASDGDSAAEELEDVARRMAGRHVPDLLPSPRGDTRGVRKRGRAEAMAATEGEIEGEEEGEMVDGGEVEAAAGEAGAVKTRPGLRARFDSDDNMDVLLQASAMARKQQEMEHSQLHDPLAQLHEGQ